MGAVLDATLDRWFTPEFRASGATDAARDRLLSDNVGAWAQAWRAMAAIDTRARLGAIRVPTLCVAGELDKSSPEIVADRRADCGARFAVILGAPHMLFIEQPKAVARVIGDFLAKLQRAPYLLSFDRDEDAAIVDALDAVDIKRRMQDYAVHMDL
jgi:3-oxoadipate enol-lactonase